MRYSILKVLAYFDIFDYPVSLEEIRFFLDQPVQEGDLKATLETLLLEQHLFRLGEFYSLQDHPWLAERRVKGNRKAEEMLKIAARSSRFLFQFPYVRGIGISGSLSKNYADENADIDYFIITQANRLWIARTFMHLFKKLSFLVGKQHWYCMNYYVDEDEMEIPEKNIFTAMEMITLLPAGGNGGLVRFFEANNWTNEYLPNYQHKKCQPEGRWHDSFLKKILEKLLDGRLGNWLDEYFQGLTSRRWQEKEARGALNIKGEKMKLHTGKHFCRPNPEVLQKRVTAAYSNKLKVLEMRLQLNNPIRKHR
ncbi:MAG TPA: hypothetical protein VE035_09190 [Puia sp.]|nr:hypothetical protein [Puia sp.]